MTTVASTSTENRIYKLCFLSILLLFTLSIVGIYNNPARGYELSIYSYTNTHFWLISIIALVIGALFLLSNISRYNKLSLYLVLLVTVSIISIPLIRGYYFVDEADALTHLGIIREIHQGIIDPIHLFYPNGHILTLIISSVLDYPLRDSMYLVIVIFCLLLIIFVPLATRLHTSSKTSIISFVITITLLPYTHLGPLFSTNLLARFFIPLSLFLLLYTLSVSTKRGKVIFILSIISLLLYHPQVALGFSLFMMGISIMLLLSSRFFTEPRIPTGDLYQMFAITILYGCILTIYLINEQVFIRALQFTIQSLISPGVSTGTSTETSSLEIVGGSVLELVIKIYTQNILYSLIAIMTVLLSTISFLGYSSTNFDLETDKLVVMIGAGTIPIFILFTVNLITAGTYMRYFYLIMVFIPIISSIAIELLLRSNLHNFLNLFMVVLLVMSIFVIFPSPYLYLDNRHVPQMHVEGYETSFEHRGSNIEFTRVRSPVFRYVHATQGYSNTDYTDYTGEYRARVPDHFANQSLSNHFDNDTYLTVTESDRIVDAQLYNGFRYSEEDFGYLERNQSIAKVYSNRGFDLYLIRVDPSTTS